MTHAAFLGRPRGVLGLPLSLALGALFFIMYPLHARPWGRRRKEGSKHVPTLLSCPLTVGPVPCLAAGESPPQARAANTLGGPSPRGVGSFLGDSGSLRRPQDPQDGKRLVRLEALR